MNKEDQVVMEFLRSPRRMTHRYVARSWWAYDDGYWVLDQGSRRVDKAILATIQELGWMKGEQTYIRTRIRTRLAGWLPSLSLPGRIEDTIVPSIVRDSHPSELPAP
jgi:DNA recombination-dependent growth factor C